jgi:hypothetical protein
MAFWYWIPGVSVGPFIFGDLAAPYIRDYSLRKRPPACRGADWDTYEFPGFESWVSVEEGRITDVHCVDAVIFNGTDLLGLSEPEILELLGEEDLREEDVGLGYALRYDRLGLMLFFVDDVVDAAACGPIFESETPSTA